MDFANFLEGFAASLTLTNLLFGLLVQLVDQTYYWTIL